jgi:hypothetical protein
VKSIRHVILHNQEAFVWIPKHRWRERTLALLISGVAIASFVGLAQLQLNTTSPIPMVASEAVSEHLFVNAVGNPPSPSENPMRASAPNPHRTSLQAVLNGSADIFDGSRTPTAVQRPAPWVIGSQ